jgi:hypothetical protein
MPNRQLQYLPRRGAALTAILAGLALAQPVSADTPIADAIKDGLSVDLSVPSSPAMAVLGMSGTEPQRPAFPRDFALSVMRGFDKDGKTKDALAIDIVPAALFFPETIVGGALYKQNYLMQLQARTTVSLAASRVEGSDSASQLAAGIRIGLIDHADPGRHYEQVRACVNKAIANVPLPHGPTTKDSPEAAAVLAAANECAPDKVVRDLWAKPALYVGYAQGWRSDSGSVRDARRQVKALWGTFSIGLNGRNDKMKADAPPPAIRALLQLHLSRKLGDRPLDANAAPAEDRSELIARIRFGKEKWHGFIDGGKARVSSAGMTTENIRRIGYGVEFQVSDTLWLVVGQVRETGFASGDRKLLSTGLRFGQAPKASVGLPGQ